MKEVLGALTPGEPVYAVLDGARDKRIRQWLIDSRATAWCLYRGELTPALENAAPWLVKLAPPWTNHFFERGWGNAWGVLFSSPIASRDLRRHLRKFLIAQTEEGKRLLFRYYDPRVLRLYLPTCTPAELDTFFGPISAFACEPPKGSAEKVLAFKRRPGAPEWDGYQTHRVRAPSW